MENEPIRDPHIIEALEACRPGSDDVADPDLVFLAAYLAANPELDEAYERLQRLDASLASAIQNVPVPEGLADRLFDRLKQAMPATPAGKAEPEPAPVEELTSEEPIAATLLPQKPTSRRWLLLGAASLALAGSLLLAVVLQHDRTVYTEAQVAEMAIRFFDAESLSPADGRLMLDSPPPRDFPISPRVFRHAQIRWRSVPQFLGQPAVAYELTRPDGARAALYVTRQTAVGGPSSPPLQPALTTHNRSASTWQSGSLLYVLVVDGGSQVYRSYLDIPRGPVATLTHRLAVEA